jgi:hypothetical protein
MFLILGGMNENRLRKLMQETMEKMSQDMDIFAWSNGPSWGGFRDESKAPHAYTRACRTPRVNRAQGYKHISMRELHGNVTKI